MAVKLLLLSVLKNQLIRQTNKLSSYAVKSSQKSSLIISGRRAENTFVVVVPYLDFENRFSKFELLQSNIKRRQQNLNLAEMKDSWSFYKDWNNKRNQLLDRLNDVNKEIHIFNTKEENKKTNVIKLKNLERHRDLLKEDLSNVKQNVWDMEDNVICELLKLPNDLHPETPDEDINLSVFDQEVTAVGCDHLKAGLKLNCVEYRNQLSCYLMNEAALFELAVSELCMNKMSKEGFIKFSNPDFSRSVLAEGVGLAPTDTQESFLLENTEAHNDLLYLCGGASIFPFCAFLAKGAVRKETLPLKLVASGRRYTPTTSSLPGLYSLNQTTSVQFFLATDTDEHLYCELQSVIKLMNNIFSELGLSYKVVKQKASRLKNWESLRVSFQVLSPFEHRYVEVGNVSLIGDYISKRLRICYSDKSEDKFLKIVSGTLLNVQSLLALCLERSTDELFIPSVVHNFMLK